MDFKMFAPTRVLFNSTPHECLKSLHTDVEDTATFLTAALLQVLC